MKRWWRKIRTCFLLLLMGICFHLMIELISSELFPDTPEEEIKSEQLQIFQEEPLYRLYDLQEDKRYFVKAKPTEIPDLGLSFVQVSRENEDLILNYLNPTKTQWEIGDEVIVKYVLVPKTAYKQNHNLLIVLPLPK